MGAFVAHSESKQEDEDEEFTRPRQTRRHRYRRGCTGRFAGCYEREADVISQNEARARVQRGAAHLDVVRPGWFNRIDVGTLTLRDPCHCVVGQLCPNADRWNIFEVGLEAIFPRSKNREGRVRAGIWHGFELPQRHMDGGKEREVIYGPLQDAWIEAIADRRLSTTVEVHPAVDAVGLSAVEPVAVHAR